MLAAAHHAGRACALAALAVEEVGKSKGLTALAGMPDSLRAQAPLRRMMEWHGLKQAAGGLIAMVQARPSMVAATLADLPERDLDQVLSSLVGPADTADRLKRAGLYADVTASGLSVPNQITGAEVVRQITRARQAADAAMAMADPREQARVVTPNDESTELTRRSIRAIARAGNTRTPAAGADVLVRAVRELIEQA